MSQPSQKKAPGSFRGLKLNLVASLVTKASGLAQLFLISRSLGLETYGAWALLNNAVSYVTQLVSLSLPNAFVRFHPTQPDAPRYERALTLLCLGASLLLALPFILAAPWLSRTFLKGPEFTPLLQAGALLIFLNVARLFLTDTLRARAELNRSALVNIAFECLETGTILLGILLGRSMPWIIFAEAILMLAAGGTVLWKLLRPDPASPTPFLPADLGRVARQYLAYSIPLVPSALLDKVASNGDRFLVGYFLGAAQIGLYNSLYAVGSVVMLFNAPFTNVLLPRVVRLFAAGDAAGAHREILRFCLAFLGIGLAAILGILAVGPWILPIVLKLGPISPTHASRLSALLILALTIFGTTRIYCLHLHARSRTRSLLMAFGGGVVVNQLANLLLIPWLGLTGTFLSCLLSYLVIAVCLWWLVQRATQSHPQATPQQAPAAS